MGKRELVALVYLSSWCLVMVERLFLAVPQGCLRFVIVVFPDHTHLLFFIYCFIKLNKMKRQYMENQENPFCRHKSSWCKWSPSDFTIIGT